MLSWNIGVGAERREVDQEIPCSSASSFICSRRFPYIYITCSRYHFLFLSSTHSSASLQMFKVSASLHRIYRGYPAVGARELLLDICGGHMGTRHVGHNMYMVGNLLEETCAGKKQKRRRQYEALRSTSSAYVAVRLPRLWSTRQDGWLVL
jgi:hypothetical protein